MKRIAQGLRRLLGQGADLVVLIAGFVLVMNNLVAQGVIKLIQLQRHVIRRIPSVPWLLRSHPLWVLGASSAALLACAFGVGRQAGAAWVVCWLVLIYLNAASYFSAIASPDSMAQLEAQCTRWPERCYTGLLRNPLDAIFARSVLCNALVMVPAFASLVLLDGYGVLHCIVGLMITAGLAEDLDHTDIHNDLFSSKHLKNDRPGRLLVYGTNRFLRLVLNPLCCRIPHFYRAYHVYVHHVENNGINDLQTTLTVDRTSFFDFCRHSMRLGWSFSVGIDLVGYLVRKRNWTQIRRLACGYALHSAVLVLLWVLNPVAALVVVLARLHSGVDIAAKTYVWHGLVDLKNADDIHHNTHDVALGPTDFGMGGALHARHHFRSGEHWLNWCHLSDTGEKYRAEIGTTGDVEAMLKALWIKDYAALAATCVVRRPMSAEAARDYIRDRTRPLHPRARSDFYQYLDDRCGRLVASLL